MSSIDANIDQEAHYRPLDRTIAGEKMALPAGDLLLLPFDTLQAACHTALQTPINSLTQMVAPEYLPKVQIIEAPERVEELSPRWHAQQLGSALGAAADIAAIEYVSRGKMRPAMIGACYDGLLRPVDSATGQDHRQDHRQDHVKNHLQDQWVERLKNAGIGSLGFGTLYGSNRVLGSISKSIENATWKSLAESPIVTSTIAGLPAGLVTTALSGGKSWHDFEIGTYTAAFTGMGLGTIHAAGQRQAALKHQKQELVELREVAEKDFLTGVGSRRGSDAALHQEFDRSVRTGRPMSLIYGDLDGFKKVNDQLGHPVGDQVLVEVGRRLKKNLRQYDHVGRTGGDEFTLVLPETDQATAQALAARLEKAIKLDVGEGNNRHTVGISLGVVTRGQDEHCLADFQKRADQEMYRIKSVRKSQFNL